MTKNKLEWHPKIVGPMTHAQALALQKDGWRVPTRLELIALFDSGGFSSAMRGKFFWSSTPYKPLPAFAWIVYFGNGYTSAGSTSNSYYVRLVRSEQSRDVWVQA